MTATTTPTVKSTTAVTTVTTVTRGGTMPYSSSQIVTPGYDPVLHRDFKGNHGDYVVFFVRKGNVVTVHESSFGGRGTVKEVIDLGQMVAKMRDLADEFGFTLDYTDDLPRGVSYPKSEYAGA